MIKEIVFQGLFGARGPARLDLGKNFCEVEIPSGVEVEDVQALLTCLFYRRRLTGEEIRRIESGRDIKVAVSFESADRVWRILRRDDDASMKLQMKDDGSYRDVAKSFDIQDALGEKLKFPAFPMFSALGFWRYDRALPPEHEKLSLDNLPEATRDMILRYHKAKIIEEYDDQIRERDEVVKQAKSKLGDAAKLEDKLEQAHEKYEKLKLVELSEDDLAILEQRDTRLQEFATQILRLEAEEEQARETVNQTLPEKPWRASIFWVGLAVTLVAIAVSIALQDQARPVAAANVIGLGLSAWAVLRYYSDMERAGIHIVRMDSIKRRLAQVREEQVAFKERVGHLLIHAGVSDQEELTQRMDKSQRLGEMIEKMEAQLDKLRARPSYQTVRQEYEKALGELEELQAERDKLGVSQLSAYQLERDLANMDIDPEEALIAVEEDGMDEVVEEPYDRDEFTRLQEIAYRAGLFNGDQLDSKVLRMWSKICGHVIGPRFKGVALSPTGELEVEALTSDQLDMWIQTRPRELRAVAVGLAVALSVNLPSKIGGMNTVIVEQPDAYLPPEHARKLREVLKSAAKRAQIVLLAKAS